MLEFRRKESESLKALIGRVRKLHDKIVGNKEGKLLRQMLASHMLSNMDNSDSNRAVKRQAQSILISSWKMEATRRHLELTSVCSFDDVANAMESSLHTFGEGAESDTDSDDDDDKIVTRGDLRKAKELSRPLYSNQDVHRPLAGNNPIRYNNNDPRRPPTPNQTRPTIPVAAANTTPQYPAAPTYLAYPRNLTCDNYLDKGHISKDCPHPYNEEQATKNRNDRLDRINVWRNS
jgi:hypothetical protein